MRNKRDIIEGKRLRDHYKLDHVYKSVEELYDFEKSLVGAMAEHEWEMEKKKREWAKKDALFRRAKTAWEQEALRDLAGDKVDTEQGKVGTQVAFGVPFNAMALRHVPVFFVWQVMEKNRQLAAKAGQTRPWDGLEGAEYHKWKVENQFSEDDEEVCVAPAPGCPCLRLCTQACAHHPDFRRQPRTSQPSAAQTLRVCHGRWRPSSPPLRMSR